MRNKQKTFKTKCERDGAIEREREREKVNERTRKNEF